MLKAKRRSSKGSNKVSIKEEMKRELMMKNNRLDMLCEKWNRTKVGNGIDAIYAKSKSKGRSVSLALQTEMAHLKRLKESGVQIRSALGTAPENVLKIIKIGVAQSNRSEFLNEWQLETPEDKYWFIDTVYGSTKRGATQDSLIYQDMNAGLYATETDTLNLGTGNDVLTTFTQTFSPTPIVPFSMKLIVNNIVIGNDDGSGKIVGTGVNSTTSSIDYTSGVITVVFTTAPASGVTIGVEANFDSEVNSNYDEWGSVELKLRSDRFHARPLPLNYSYSQFFALTLDANGLGDAEEMLVKRVGDTHAIRKDVRGVQALRRAADLNNREYFNTDPSSDGDDNQYNHAQSLMVKIAKISGLVYDELKRGTLNKVVMGTQAAAYLTYLKAFTPDDTQGRVSGSYYAGKLGTIDTYVIAADSKTIAANEMVFTYKNPDEDGDVAIAVGMFTELFAQLDYPELFRKSTIATVEDTKVINSRFARILELQGL